MAKIAPFDGSSSFEAMQTSPPSLLTSCNNFFSEGGQQMLSFSSPKSQNTVTFPPCSNAYLKNAGGIIDGVKGLFTLSQWMELEHQALIYKYIDANAPVPTYLLNPIRKAFDSAGFASFVGLRPVSYGWGGYNLGCNPEPGRCRRTDGKKWRCSKEAVADHKYCARHMNRGRHRSRKPVESQSGHSISGTKDVSAKLQPVVSSALEAVVPGGGASNSLKGNQYSFPKQSFFQEDSQKEEFGRVCSGSLLNPFNKSSLFVESNTDVRYEDLRHCKNNKSYNGLRQLFVDWSSSQSEQTLPDIEFERTQLSISIPMAAASDFMSSTLLSPTIEKVISSPLRLSQDLETTQMELPAETTTNDQSNGGKANWIPISWKSSMGGPLAEVLTS